ncbi:Uncharacterized protein TCM_035771 [Theobroma cacao]|uniref:Uncharacterized protein n=1 Tax=Theobroma cacao TaxID=3641 RepID=A0A061FIX0_THECC|nr:Uncharacterized protein TCM_035771 [Theobroma cacao]
MLKYLKKTQASSKSMSTKAIVVNLESSNVALARILSSWRQTASAVHSKWRTRTLSMVSLMIVPTSSFLIKVGLDENDSEEEGEILEDLESEDDSVENVLRARIRENEGIPVEQVLKLAESNKCQEKDYEASRKKDRGKLELNKCWKDQIVKDESLEGHMPTSSRLPKLWESDGVELSNCYYVELGPRVDIMLSYLRALAWRVLLRDSDACSDGGVVITRRKPCLKGDEEIVPETTELTVVDPKENKVGKQKIIVWTKYSLKKNLQETN